LCSHAGHAATNLGSDEHEPWQGSSFSDERARLLAGSFRNVPSSVTHTTEEMLAAPRARTVGGSLAAAALGGRRGADFGPGGLVAGSVQVIDVYIDRYALCSRVKPGSRCFGRAARGWG